MTRKRSENRAPTAATPALPLKVYAAVGAFFANVALLFILVLFGGLLLYLLDTGRRYVRAMRA